MVVSNTTVILYFIKIQRADLLQNIFSQIVIPSEVHEELTGNEEEYAEEVVACRELAQKGFLIVKDVQKVENYGLDKGENAALSLCGELYDNEFLSDDKSARKVARLKGYTVKGTLGILFLNLETKKITNSEFFVLLDTLINQGFYLSTEVYSAILRKFPPNT